MYQWLLRDVGCWCLMPYLTAHHKIMGSTFITTKSVMIIIIKWILILFLSLSRSLSEAHTLHFILSITLLHDIFSSKARIRALVKWCTTFYMEETEDWSVFCYSVCFQWSDFVVVVVGVSFFILSKCCLNDFNIGANGARRPPNAKGWYKH